MNLKSINEIPEQTRVALRIDTDLPGEGNEILDNSRLVKSLSTIKTLLNKQCRIVILGHRGRPNGYEEKWSLRPVYLELMSLLEERGEQYESVFVDNFDAEVIDQKLGENQIVFLENVRYESGEENNDKSFLQGVVQSVTAVVNDAFGVAHRDHASTTLHRVLPGFYGNDFIEEIKGLEKIVENPDKPMLLILGGAKEDKLKHVDKLLEVFDKVLIGGKLPKLIGERDNPKLLIAKLDQSGLDIDEESINDFKEIINSARTIVWAGAVGYYEDINHRQGTAEVAKVIAQSNAYKVIAGGDTKASIKEFGLLGNINFCSSGGGVVLEYLANGSLAGCS